MEDAWALLSPFLTFSLLRVNGRESTFNVDYFMQRSAAYNARYDAQFNARIIQEHSTIKKQTNKQTNTPTNKQTNNPTTQYGKEHECRNTHSQEYRTPKVILLSD